MSRFLQKFRRNPFFYLAFLGPGLIATAAGNDAGGIATYSTAGAKFGLSLLWIWIPLTVAFVFVQELSVKLGAVTGKGFSDLVRENFSIRSTVFMMTLLLLGNAGLVVSEFAGIAAAMELFGISKYISIPVSALIVWWMIVKGSYHKVEKVFIVMSLILLSYVVTVFIAKPDWLMVGKSLITPNFSTNQNYLKLLVALIGTTIAPFMQVYAQSAVVEKGITANDFYLERIDSLVGTLFSSLIAAFIVISTAVTLFPAGVNIDSAAEAAQALVPFAGQFAQILFGVGLLGASFLAAGVVPLTTSFALSNAFGWESGVNRSLDEAPVFYAIFTFLIVLGATIVLSPAVSLINLLIGLQVINGLLLPIQLVFMAKLGNNQGLMGKHKNSTLFNVVLYTTIVGVSTAAFLYLGSTVLSFF